MHAGDVYRMRPVDRLMPWIRAGRTEKARLDARATPTAELYTLRRDLVRAVEIITDETERRHIEQHPGPEPS